MLVSKSRLQSTSGFEKEGGRKGFVVSVFPWLPSFSVYSKCLLEFWSSS